MSVVKCIHRSFKAHTHTKTIITTLNGGLATGSIIPHFIFVVPLSVILNYWYTNLKKKIKKETLKNTKTMDKIIHIKLPNFMALNLRALFNSTSKLK